MIASEIWNQLVLTLKAPSLSYINGLYEGIREDFTDENSLPCIMLEPKQNGESQLDMNRVKNIYFDVDLYAFTNANYNEFPKTIVGDESYKGILDIEQDIRAVLQRSYTLDNLVIDTRPGLATFDSLDIGKYPVRGLVMPIRILYRQINEA